MQVTKSDINLFAHLMRRAGFGSTHEELTQMATKEYDVVVDELLNSSSPHSMPQDIIRRYHVDQSELRIVDSVAANWIYRMVTTNSPLEDKIALFWHGLFATGERKVNNAKTMQNQINMFREYGLGSLPTLLVKLSQDPAMIHWLDNNDNHKGAINENFGRELLELFSMGIGNYTEQDIKECSRAFTGWTMENAEYMALRSHKASIWPYSRVAWQFEYRDFDHDNGEKVFLGETGNFNGQDIIEIIARQPATARFISTRLYQFFVADEVSEDGESLIDQLQDAYFASGYEIRAMLSTLFNSDHFKSEDVRFARVKSPVELVVGTLRLAQVFRWPSIDINQVALSTNYMGQELFNPTTVEGWHEGNEWIDSGALMERVNFASQYIGNLESPGVQSIITDLTCDKGDNISPEEVVEGCLDLLGPLTVSDRTRNALLEHASREGYINLSDGQPDDVGQQRIAEILRLIVSTREYQLA